MKYKVGDKVRVRQWDDMAKEFGVNNGNIPINGCLFVKEMKQYCGRTYEVYDTSLYYILATENEVLEWCFADSMLEDVNSLSYTPDSSTLETEDTIWKLKDNKIIGTPKSKKEDKEMKQKTQRERLEEQLEKYQDDSNVYSIKIVIPGKVVKVTMNDFVKSTYVMKCHEEDEFSLEKAIIIAYTKSSAINLTPEGIEYEADRFHYYKSNMKKLKKAMKVYEIQQKLKALDEEEERIRANKKRKKIAQKKRRAERLAEEKLKETKEAAKIYAEELKSVLAGYDIPVETTDKIVKDMNIRM